MISPRLLAPLALIAVAPVVAAPMAQAASHPGAHIRSVATNDPRGDVKQGAGGASARQQKAVDIRHVDYSSDGKLLLVGITVTRLRDVPGNEFFETTVREGKDHVLITAEPGARRVHVFSGDQYYVCPGSGTTVDGSVVTLQVPVRCLNGFTKPTLKADVVLAKDDSTPIAVDRARVLGPFRL